MATTANLPGTHRDGIVDTLEFIYGPVIIGLGFTILYVSQDPANEVVLGLLHELVPPNAWWNGTPPGMIVRQVMSLTLLWALPVAVWSAAWLAVRQSRTGNTGYARWLSRAAAAAVFTGLLYGTWAIATGREAKNLGDMQLWIFYGGIPTGLLYGFLLHRAILGFANFTLYDRRNPSLGESVATVLVLLILILPILWIGFIHPAHSYVLGPVGVASAFAISAAYFLASLTMVSIRAPYSIPMILVLVAMILALTSHTAAAAFAAVSALCLVLWFTRFWWEKGNRTPRPWLAEWRGVWTLAALVALTVFGVFASWLSSTTPSCGTLSGCNLLKGVTPQNRGQLRTVESFAQWSERDAPVIRLIAAQGGGLYAAYHTAYYLAARADEDPGFARSIFAISGVSGGSVGAGVFWSIRKSGLCEIAELGGRCHRDAVQAILQHDFLSPTLAAFLFRDSLDSIVPISYLASEPIDRGRVLEDLFAHHVARVTGAEGLLDTALADSWGPDHGLPVLMFNGTEVGTGDRTILSPLPLLPRDVPARIILEGGKDLTVGNAMTISARFPLVTPPARIRRPDAAGRIVVRQLVDGGYFDNSGIETILEALGDIIELRAPAQVEVLVFNVAEPETAVEIKGTVGAPIAAFTGAWRARRDLTTARLDAMAAEALPVFSGSTMGQNAPPKEDGNERLIHAVQQQAKSSYAAYSAEQLKICPVTMFEQTMNFTVSWYLTTDTFREIEVQMEDLASGKSPRHCVAP